MLNLTLSDLSPARKQMSSASSYNNLADSNVLCGLAIIAIAWGQCGRYGKIISSLFFSNSCAIVSSSLEYKKCCYHWGTWIFWVNSCLLVSSKLFSPFNFWLHVLWNIWTNEIPPCSNTPWLILGYPIDSAPEGKLVYVYIMIPFSF